jgi:uncharacterized protein
MTIALIAAACAVLAGGLFAIVWHVSNRAYREAMGPQAGAIRAATRARVVERSDAEVVLEPGGKRALKTVGVWGLSWDGGFARISDPVRESGAGVRYSVELMGGELAAGESCELEPAAFPPDSPESAGMSEVVYPSPFGDYTGWFAPGTGTTWLILVHGKTALHREMLRMVDATRGQGLPTLSVTYRNDEGAPSTDDGLPHFGRDEWRDLEAAIEYALARGASDVVIAAESIGASVALWFLHESRLADRVRGLVFDSPMLDVGSSMVWVGKTASVVPAVVVRLGMVLTARRLHFRWPDYDARPIFRELKVPVAMIHGERDGQTPMAVSEAMAALRPDLVTLERVPGAGHCQTWNMDPAAYEAVFNELLRRALGDRELVAAGAGSAVVIGSGG